MYVNWIGRSADEWEKLFIEGRAESGKTKVVNFIKKHLPSHLALAICTEVTLKDTTLAELKKQDRTTLIELLVNYKLPIKGHAGYSAAEVTGGGIPLTEIDITTMQSKVTPGTLLLLAIGVVLTNYCCRSLFVW